MTTAAHERPCRGPSSESCPPLPTRVLGPDGSAPLRAEGCHTHRSCSLCLQPCLCVLGTQSCLSVAPWTVARQALLSTGFSGPEHWSGLPFRSPGDLPDPGIEPVSPSLQPDSLPPGQRGSPQRCLAGRKVKVNVAQSCPTLCNPIAGIGVTHRLSRQHGYTRSFPGFVHSD